MKYTATSRFLSTVSLGMLSTWVYEVFMNLENDDWKWGWKSHKLLLWWDFQFPLSHMRHWSNYTLVVLGTFCTGSWLSSEGLGREINRCKLAQICGQGYKEARLPEVKRLTTKRNCPFQVQDSQGRNSHLERASRELYTQQSPCSVGMHTVCWPYWLVKTWRPD